MARRGADRWEIPNKIFRRADCREGRSGLGQTEASGVTLGKPSALLSAPLYASTLDVVAAYRQRLVLLKRADSYMRDVDLILGSFTEKVTNLTAPDAGAKVESWLLELKSSGRGRGGKSAPVGASRRNKYLVIVRAMCRWAVRKGRIAVDPTTQEDFAQTPRYLKPQFSLDECRKLARHGDSETHRWIMLMLYAGLRADEARCLRWSDIDWSGGAILIKLEAGGAVKREKERIVPLQPELRRLLEPKKGDGRVVKLGRGNLQRAFADLLTAAKIQHDGRSPHSCRHTYAGLMTATGVPTTLLRAYLGHESEKTTQGYAQMAARFVGGTGEWKRGEFNLLS